MKTFVISVYYLFNKSFLVWIHLLPNKTMIEFLANFFEVFLSSEKVVDIPSNFIVGARLPRCKGVEISNKTLTTKLCGSTICFYVEIVKIALNLLT